MSRSGTLPLRDLVGAVAAAGLMLRGGFHPEPEDSVPALPDGRPTVTLVMLGNAGPALWGSFARSAESGDGAPDPLDRWTRRTVGAMAERFGATPLFPFGLPHHPFQRWAMRADAVAPSPLGILIHPDFGLWHAYRAALAFPSWLALGRRDARPSPCTACAERPCLSACPVGAFTGHGYLVESCLRHLAAPAGKDCMDRGCRARRACPVGAEFRPGADQALFHMQAFRRAQRG